MPRSLVLLLSVALVAAVVTPYPSASIVSAAAAAPDQLSVSTAVDPAGVDAVGERINYTITITNTGTTALTGLTTANTFTNPAAPASTLTCTPSTTTLAAGQSTTCTTSYLTTQADLDRGSVVSSATAHADASDGSSVDQATTTTVPATQAPALTFDSSAAPVTVSGAGRTVRYTFTATNSGNVTLNDLAIASSFTAPALDSGLSPITCDSATLAPGAVAACTATYSSTAADVANGSIRNIAHANASTGLGDPVASPSATTDVAVTDPALDVSISPAPTSVTAVGQVVTYSYLVHNTGNVTIHNLTVAPAMTSPASGSGLSAVTCPVTTLDPDASTTCTATYTTTRADLDHGSIVTTATASGDDPDGVTVTSPRASATVDASEAPSLSMTATTDPTTVNAAGQVVSYSFVVTNSGDVPVSGLAVAETFTSPAGSQAPDVNCPVVTLAPGASTTCTATYTTTQADIDNGTLVDRATASGTGPAGAPASVTASVTVAVAQSPALSLAKSATPTTVSAPGQTITYSFAVSNVGNVTVTGLSISDAFTSPPGPHVPAITCPVTTLAPGDATTCTAAYTTTQDDIDSGAVVNTATASATAPGSVTVTSDPSTATVGVGQVPALTLTKSATPTTISAAGQAVSYSFVVTNSGNVTVSGIAVADSYTSPAASVAPTVTCPVTSLAPDASTTCSATYTTTQADIDNGTLVDRATVSGTGPGGAPASATATATVAVTQSPSLSLTKSASPTTVSAPGQTVTYTIVASNTGNQTLTGVDVSDLFTAPAGPRTALSCAPDVPARLAPGASVTCTATYVTTQADIDAGAIINTADAAGKDPHGATVSAASSTATVAVTQSPVLTLTKTAAPATVSAPGQSITYSFVVSNGGNVTVTGLSIADAFTSPSGAHAPSITCITATLAPGGATTCTAVYTTTQADIDSGAVVNQATASATAPGNVTVTSAPSTAAVAVAQTPSLSLVKSASTASVVGAGQRLDYSFLVKNTGNVTITGLGVVDSFTSPADSIAPVVSCPLTTLAPGASTICTAPYTTTQDDIDNGILADLATASATAPGNVTVSSNASAAVLAVQQSGLTLTKSAAPTRVTAAGQAITYSFLVTNTGNVTVSRLAVADSFTSPAGDIAPTITCPTRTLAPNVSTTCTATYVVTQADIDFGSLSNAAVASATAPGNVAVGSNGSTATVDVTQSPALSLTKSGFPTTLTSAGQTVTYSFLARNTGNVTLTGLYVIDDFVSPDGSLVPTVTCPVNTLAPNVSTTCTATYTTTQDDIDNGTLVDTATAFATAPGNTAVTSNASTATLTVAQAPLLSLVKSASRPSVIGAGQRITYTFVVTNVGNVTVSGIAVTDAFTSPPAAIPPTVSCPATTLAPGETTTCSGSYTTTQADIDNGTLVDTATASGTGPGGGTATSNTSTAAVSVTQTPQLSLVKSASLRRITAPGQVIRYSFAVKNTGNVSVTALHIVDTFTSPPSAIPPVVTCPTTTLAPGVSTTCTATYTTTQADIDSGNLVNSATAVATAPGNATVTSNVATASVSATGSPSLDLSKSASPSTVSAAGQRITYSFLVTNTGNVTVTGLSVVDSFTSPATAVAPTVTCPVTNLAPAAVTTCTATYTATQTDIDNGSLINTATASATAPDTSAVVSGPSSATVGVNRAPALSLTKTASPTTVSAAGQSIAYSFAVRNTGNVTVTGLTVADRFLQPATATAPAVTCPVTTLAPGASTTCTATYVTTQTDIDNGTLIDLATASATAPGNSRVTSNASTAIVQVAQAPQLALVKSASHPTVTTAGQTVDYSFQVTNTGNVTLTGLRVVDAFTSPGTSTTPTVVCPVTVLAPGASTTCTSSYVVTQADIDNGTVTDTATASAKNPDGSTAVSNTSTATVGVTRGPQLTLQKSASPTTLTGTAGTVVYSFLVTNAGNVTVTGLSVHDTFTAPPGAAAPPVTCPVTAIAPGESTTCTATYTATQSDVDSGSLVDTATATGVGAGNAPVSSNSSTATVTITRSPSLSVVKTASVSSVTGAGQTVRYQFLVRNTGNVTLTGLTVADTFVTPAGAVAPTVSCPVTKLAPAAFTRCTASYVATQADVDGGILVDTATASATGPDNGTVTSNPSTATVNVIQSPELIVTKSVSPTTVSSVPGSTLTYSFRVDNSGNVTVTALSVTDRFTSPASSLPPTVTCPVTTLAPNASTICTATYLTTATDVANGTLRNIATASGTAPGNTPVTSNTSFAQVIVTSLPGGMSLVKSVVPSTVTAAGQTVQYSFLVTNTTAAPVTGLTINDTFVFPAAAVPPTVTCPLTTLAPGGSTTCTAPYVTTQVDVDTGVLINDATAHATAPGNVPIGSNVSVATVTFPASPALTLVKSATPAAVTAAGQTISYSFLTTNTGNVTLHRLGVTDTFTTPDTATAPTVSCPLTTLAPGQSTTCTATYTVTQDDADGNALIDTATASATGPGRTPITSNSSTATVQVNQVPLLSVVKTATPTTVTAAAQPVIYRFAVTNTGSVSVTGLSVADTFTSPASSVPPAVVCPLTTLAPGASTTCAASYTTTQADIDNGTLTDSATASAVGPGNTPASSNVSTATVAVTQTPLLSLRKTAARTTVTAAGQSVLYAFVLKNTGNVTVSGLSVSDAFTTPVGAPAPTVICPVTTLAPGDMTTCTGSYTTTQTEIDFGSLTNTATASGTAPGSTPVASNASTVTVLVIPAPALTLIKTASPTVVTAAGQTVSYSFSVQNTGNKTLTSLAVADAFTSPATATAPTVTCPLSTLAPGAGTVCTATYTTTQSDIDNGTLVNVATVSGRDPSGALIASDPSTATVDVAQSGALFLTETATPPTVDAPGETVTYAFVLQNRGNVSVTGLTVGQSVPGTVTCVATTLAPGASTTCASTYVTTQADIDRGSLVNSATASGRGPDSGVLVSNTTSASVAVVRSPVLTLTKSGSPATVSAVGQTITYTFGVQNAGNVTASKLAILDAFTAPPTAADPTVTCLVTTIAPGASVTCTATYTTTQADLDNGVLVNSATASAVYGGTKKFTSNTATASVGVTQLPVLSLVKSVTPVVVTAVGQPLDYTFVVVNTGNVTVSGLDVADAFTSPASDVAPNPTCPVSTLAPGDSTTCTASYTTTQTDIDNGALLNTAAVSGLSPLGVLVTSNTSTAAVTATQAPVLSITKKASLTVVTAPGQAVRYTFVVKNTGNVTVHGLQVADVFTSPSTSVAPTPTCAVTTLLPGASVTCSTSYVTTQNDIDNGTLQNSATASARSPADVAVTSNVATATVNVTRSPSLSLIKSATPTTVTAAGQPVAYSFLVKNTGNVTISAVHIADVFTSPTGSTAPAITCPLPTLAPGVSTTCTGTYPVTQLDMDNGVVKNTATAVGTAAGNIAVTSNPSSATVQVIQAPALSVVKSAAPGTVTAAGQSIVYSFLVLNTGNVTLTGITVADTFTSPASAPAPSVSCPVTTIAPGVSTTCTATYVTRQADIDNGVLKNSATASGIAPGNVTLSSDPSTATATVAVTQSPVLSLVKSALPTTVTAAGQSVVYSFLVTNTGNVTVSGLSVADAFTSPATAVAPNVSCPVTTLAPGVATTCTGTYVTTQVDVDNGTLVDTATASGKSPLNVSVTSNPSTATVAVTQSPVLTLVKSALPTTVTAAGQSVVYSFLVRNTGNVTVTGVTIADTFTSPATATAPNVTCPVTTLAPGVATTCTGTYTTTQIDIDNGTLVDTATASGKSPANVTVSSLPSTATVAVTRAPVLTLVKSATPGTVTAAGQSVAYSFLVRNTGNVTVTGLTVADTFTSPVTATAPSVSCPVTTLAPAASTTCTAAYVTTQTDIDNGTLVNSARASGTAPGNTPVLSNTSVKTVAVTRTPVLTVTKTATPTTVTAPGQTIAYTIAVHNTGNVTLTAVGVTDVFTAPAGPGTVLSCTPGVPVTLSPGASVSCTLTYVSTQADVDAGTIVNTASASGKSPSNTTVTAVPSTATVIATQTPVLTLVKSALPVTVTAAGQSVAYSFLVTNTGNVTVSGLTVADSFTSPATSVAPVVSCPVTTLAPGVATTCTATYVTTQVDVDNGTLRNTATASGKSPLNVSVSSNPSTATVAVTQTPVLSLVKSALPATVTAAGQSVVYSFLVRNTGNVTVTGVAISDSFTSPATATAPNVTCPVTTLAPGVATTCTGTYTTTQIDIDNGTLVDTATAAGKSPANVTVTSNASTATVAVTRSPVLTLVKSATPGTVTAAGQSVAYTFLVRNTGNVTITGVAITDAFTSPATATAPSVNCPVTTLAPGGSTTCTAAYVTTQTDIDNGTLVNSATASGTAPGNTPVTSNVSVKTVAVTRSPALTVTKTATPTTVTAPGQTVTYTIAVRNTGNVTLTAVGVGDVFTAPAGPGTALSCTPAVPVTLAPAASVSCTLSYVSTQADVDAGTIVNTASASGKSPSNTTVTATPSTATVAVTQSPVLTLVKSALPTTVTAAGQSVVYSFLVTNAGNVTVSGLGVADSFTSPVTSVAPAVSCPVTTLAPGVSTTCTATYVITQTDIDNGTLRNTANASGKSPLNVSVSSSPSTATVAVTQSPALSLVKSALPITVTAAGQSVVYSFLVRNTGNVTVTGVAITDAFTSPATAVAPSVSCPVTTLAPGVATTCTGSYTTTQIDIDNGTLVDTATAAGKSPANVTVTSNASTATVNVTRSPVLTLVKSATPGTVTAAGQSVAYTFLVRNTGNVTVTGVAISDAFTSPATATAPNISCPLTTLVPGGSTTCTATYVTTQTDIDNGTLVNSATASGTAPGNTPVTSNVSVKTVAVTRSPALSITKTAAPTTITGSGQTVAYSFLVRNTGNVSVTGIAIADAFTSPATSTAPTVTCPLTALAPAGATTCTATYVTAQTDIDNGTLVNAATASATAAGGATVNSNVSTATVAVTQSPVLSLVKSALPTTVTAAGQPVVYSFLVTNTGNVTITGVAISDVFTSPATATAPTVSCPVTTLAPGAATTCTGTYLATQTDLDNGTLVDTATASGKSPLNVSVTSNPSTATVAVTQSPVLSLVKSALPTTVTAAGQSVVYSFLVRNTGNVTVTGLSVADAFTSPATATAPNVTCPVTTLAPGVATTCTGTYTTTQIDIDNGTLVDTATASAKSPANVTVTSNSSTATVIATRSPALHLTKTASRSTITAAGQTIVYTFLVENRGNVTDTGLSVTDAFTSPATATAPTATCIATTLVPGASTTCSATYTTTQTDIDNGTLVDTATASATAPDGGGVTSNPDTVAVLVAQSPVLTLTKSPQPTSVAAAGSSVVYSFVVTNTGNVTLTGISVTDAFTSPPSATAPAVTCPVTTLAPAGSTTCTSTYAATQTDIDNGQLINRATASGINPAHATVQSNAASATVVVTQAPALMLTKSAAPTTVTAAGQSVVYSFLVENTGNVTVTGVAITDAFTSPASATAPAVSCPLTTLVPGGSTTCTGTYVTTQTDIDNGSLVNAATAAGTAPGDAAVTSNVSTAAVAVTQAPQLVLTKSAAPTTVTAAGQRVVYSFLVENTGNVTVSGIAITDAFTSPNTATAPDVSCPSTTLAPGAATTCTGTYVPTQTDIDNGVLINTATAAGTGPGNGAVTSNVSTAAVAVTQAPQLVLTKSAAPTTVSAAGQSVVYSFLVENTGNVTVSGIAITDAFTSPNTATAPDVSCPSTTLAPGAATTCTGTYVTTQTDIDNGTLLNTATAAGTAPGDVAVTSNVSTAAVAVTQAPQLLLTKSAAPTTVTAAGQSVVYSFLVENTGNVTLSGLHIDDAFTSPASATPPAVSCPTTSLDPGASTTCTGTYVTTQDDIDNGTLVNTATAVTAGPAGATVTSNASTAAVDVTRTPDLMLTKTADPTTVTAAGQTVDYTFLVENTGNVTVTGLSIADTFTSPASSIEPTVTCPLTTLAPGASTTCTASYVTTQDDIDNGTLANTATASGAAPDGTTVTSNPSSAQVDAPRTPVLTLTKSASPTAVSTAGQAVDYSFLVRNDGNVTVSALDVTDTYTAPAGAVAPVVHCPVLTLAPGDSTTCSASIVITQDDIDNGASLVDSATATGTAPGPGTVTSNISSAAVTVVQTPALTLTKSAAPTTVTAAGRTVDYSFLVANTGNVTVSGLEVADAFTSPAAAIAPAVSCPVTTLAPSDSTTCTASYVTTQDDIDNGTLVNAATATAVDPLGGAVTSNQSPATVAVTQSPVLTLTKSAAPTTVTAAGQTVDYSFLVVNNGNVTVSGLAVTDAFTSPTSSVAPTVVCPSTSLAPAASTTCTAAYVTTQDDVDNGTLVDTATASGTAPDASAVTSNASTATVAVTQSPVLTLTKSATPTTVTAAGQTVDYSFLVVNDGNVTVTDLAVSDSFTSPASATEPAVSCPVATLPPAASTTCTASYVTTQDDIDNGTLVNTATASGTAPDASAVTSNTSTATVAVTQSPVLTLTKSASPTTVTAAGQTVDYSFLVVNDGNVTVTGLGVVDAFTSPASAIAPDVSCPLTTLAPGDSTTCTASYVTTQDDIDNGTLVDTATGSGTAPDASAVTSNASTATVAVTQSPVLTLTKSASPTTVTAPGQTVDYSFLVVNDGNVTVTGLGVVDAFTSPPTATAPTVSCQITTLAPGASTTCTASYVTTQDEIDNGTLANTATASASGPDGVVVASNASSATVSVGQAPVLTLTKSASPTTVTAAGQTVDYSFLVVNDGNVTVTGLGIADAFTSPAGAIAPAVSCPLTALVPGGSTTCTGSYVTKQNDIDNGSLTNAATANALDPTGRDVGSNTSAATVNVVQASSLVLTKSASPTTVTAAGQKVDYSFLVTNTGNVTVTGLAISDAFTSPASAIAPTVTCPVTTLAPGDSTTCTAPYVTTQTDIDNGTLTNTATATGTAPSDTAVTSDPSIATVTVRGIAALTLVKRATTAAVSAVGDVVRYTFTVTNTGTVTLHNLHIDDELAAPAGAANLSAIACPTTTLKPGEKTTCSARYTTTAADLAHGSIKNSATASASTPFRSVASAKRSTAVVRADQAAPTSSTRSTGQTLPDTGVNNLPQELGGAAGLIVLGLFLLLASRRRRRHRS